jgi:hemerythrin
MVQAAREENKIYLHTGSSANHIDTILIDSVPVPGLNLMIIGKNISIINNTVIDLLAVDEYGNPAAIIRTFDTDSEIAFEKILDITLWLDKLSFQTIDLYCQAFNNKSFHQVYEEKFNSSISKIDNSSNYILYVAETLDTKTEMIIDDMIHKYRIAINALILEKIRNENEEYILQSWLTDPKTNHIPDSFVVSDAVASWNDSYMLGIPIIDRQHKMFFKLYDEVVEKSATAVSEHQILNTIEQIEHYVAGHFHTEEILFKRSDFHESKQHIQEHEIFRKKAAAFRVGFDYKNSQLVNQILTFFRKWFLSHISNSDMRYKKNVDDYINSI